MTNYVENCLKDLVKFYASIKLHLWSKTCTWSNNDEDYVEARRIYQQIVVLVTQVKTFLQTDYLGNNKTTHAIAELTRIRVKQLIRQFGMVVDMLSMLITLLCKFKHSASNEKFKIYTDMIVKHAFTRIRMIIRQPLSYFPDLSLWLVASSGSGGSFKEDPVGVGFFFNYFYS